jgi:hypothetical protein
MTRIEEESDLVQGQEPVPREESMVPEALGTLRGF